MFEHQDYDVGAQAAGDSQWAATATFAVGVTVFVVVWWLLGQS
jgi:hypothetical protein